MSVPTENEMAQLAQLAQLAFGILRRTFIHSGANIDRFLLIHFLDVSLSLYLIEA